MREGRHAQDRFSGRVGKVYRVDPVVDRVASGDRNWMSNVGVLVFSFSFGGLELISPMYR